MTLNILYLSHNMQLYKGANYQQDFINELKKNNKLFLYGPGFKHYKEEHTLEDVMSIFDRKPEIIFVGHSWLNDDPKKNLLIKNKIDLSVKKYFKIFFLNKEYVKLNDKLKFFNENKFNLGFSHHHKVDFYSKETNTQCSFIPFAFNKDLFESQFNNQVKKYDLGFSGIIQNQNKNAEQSDIRRRITKKLFHTFFDIPIIKKNRLSLFWNVIPSSRISRYLATSFNYYKFYDVEDYIKKLFECKIYINTLSPINLVSPRYFETFASNSILLCEKSNVYDKIFEGKLKYFTFDKDLKNFNDQVYSLLNDYGNISDIISNNRKCVYNNHTWENRVIKVIDLINKR